MYWCCPSRPCMVFLTCVHLALFLALSLSPHNSLVSSWCDHSMLASWNVSRRVSSFFLSVQFSQPYIATGHTSAFISRIFGEIGMLWLFHIVCSDALITCPLFNLVQNPIVHSPTSVIRDPRYGNVSTCSSCSFWMSTCSTLCRHSPLLWSCRRWWVGCIYCIVHQYLLLTWSRRSTSSCSSASEEANRMMSSA